MSHPAEVPGHLNEVHLVGRLAIAPTTRELPSGDVLLSLRLVVGRVGGRKGAPPRSPTVDTLDCAVWRADVRRRALSLQPGETIEIHGALRRRFWALPT